MTTRQLQKAIDDQLAGDGSALRFAARELHSERAELLKALQEIADESVKHHEHNPISGKDRLPAGYTKILNIADRALRRSNNKVTNAPPSV